MTTFDRLFPGHGGPVVPPLIWLIGFFAFLNVYSIQSVLPLLVQEFGVTPSEAGMTVGATVLGVALLSPFMGMLSDAWGRKVLICASMLLLALPTVGLAYAPSLAWVLVLRFVQGLAVPGIVVSTVAYVAEECQDMGVARLSSLYVGGAVMGGFCGRLIAGHSAEWLGWRGAFVVMAVLVLLGALAVLWGLPASRHFKANPSTLGALQVLGRHLRNRRLLAACLVGFCVLFSLVGTFTYVNLYLAAAPFHLSPAGLANVFAIYLVGVVVGRLVDRFGVKPSMLVALTLSALGLLATLPPSLAWVLLGLTVCSTGVFVCQSITISFVGDNVVEGRSLAMGLYNTCYYAGGAVGAWVVGFSYEGWGWHGAILTLVAAQALAAAITGWSWPARGRRAVQRT